MKVETDLPPQGVNGFVNGFVHCLLGAHGYQNKPKIMQNEPE